MGNGSRHTVSFCAAAVALIVVALASEAGAEIIGVTFSTGDSAFGSLYSINEHTAVSTLIGSTGASRLNSLARRADGTLFSAGGDSNNQLYTINPVTGTATVVATLSSADFPGLSFAPNGTLYGIHNNGTPNALLPDDLVTINTATGAVTLVGTTPYVGIQDIAFSPTGALYGWEVGAGNGIGVGLITINPATGTAADVNPTVEGTANT